VVVRKPDRDIALSSRIFEVIGSFWPTGIDSGPVPAAAAAGPRRPQSIQTTTRAPRTATICCLSIGDLLPASF
jgi:hypothetical protein